MSTTTLLSDVFGFDAFRPGQQEIVEAVIAGENALAIMPTGGGKSLCFQLPALVRNGVTVVISPLIALMRDQVRGLREAGVEAGALTSGNTPEETDAVWEALEAGTLKLLYMAPERLASGGTMNMLRRAGVSLIAVDEAHCVSQWGHDFRPDYLRIGELKRTLDVPLAAFTATADAETREEIVEKLFGGQQPATFLRGFDRPNIHLHFAVKDGPRTQVLNFAAARKGQSGIVYCGTRAKTETLAKALADAGHSTCHYHGGMEAEDRRIVERRFQQEDGLIVCATVAFGMGIDKPDVAFVVHLDIPESLEAYFQEAGRAGRDGQKAYAILLYDNTDILDLEAKTKRDFPEVETIRQTYQGLANYFRLAIGSGKDESYPFDLSDFSRQYKIPAIQVYNSLKFLEKEGYVSLSDALHLPSRVLILMKKDELYHFQIKNKTFDAYLQLLLRSYSGLFDEYVKIRETELARRANLPKRKLIEALEKLNELEVISYIPQTRLPQIVFLRERTDAKKLTISHEHYHDRMSAALARVKAVIKYVTAGQQCRSRMLLMYFGEKESARCGICDRCLERNKLPVTNLEFEQITEQIKDILLERPMLMHQLIPLIIGVKESETIKVIQWLIDNGKVREVGEQKLSWIR